ncbi:Non-specific lipid-transfer protein [Roseibium sp. TrichSKD4]|uniref:SCP2 sterol-binding domain-containing protein n=1 Tax=Roseibium sp. TrichSKD4 TaxID=744980 RepID=UPI0001E56E64|nr:SCP2 sterol-binding domain-containing protein [Roseibium sp. TrichSKD4]EFO32173.1 Non-specific lipid-transfer protein [Roseibium sp. TrichSKD4]
MSLVDLTETVRSKVSGGGIDESVKFDLGEEGQIFVQGAEVSNENKDADCTITMSSEDLGEMLAGDLDPTAAFMGGKLKVDGDMSVAMKLGSIV